MVSILERGRSNFVWGPRAALAIAVAVLLAAGGAAGAQEGVPEKLAEGVKAAPVPAAAVDVLDLNSNWRWHMEMREGRMKAPDGSDLGPVATRGTSGVGVGVSLFPLDSQPVPGGWTAPDLDDSQWPQSFLSPKDKLGVRGIENGSGRNSSCAVLSLRGKFEATDLAAVRPLYLTLKYCGGVVVYLNGKEVARSGLPDGELKPEVMAIAYPETAWVGPDGKKSVPQFRLESLKQYFKYTDEAVTEIKKRLTLRVRELGPVAIPAGLSR